MPHTNNPAAKARKANRHGPKPKFLVRAKKSKGNAAAEPLLDADGNPLPPAPLDDDASLPAASDEGPRSEKAALIAEYHALEKQLASPAVTDPLERRMLLNRQKELGGLKAYQAASVHGGDKKRGGESGKWCVSMLKEMKVGVDKGKGKEKVEPTIMPDGTKQYPKVVRAKVSFYQARYIRRRS
jgi:25S rRNA (adenine2142-N1)-methyltransferase